MKLIFASFHGVAESGPEGTARIMFPLFLKYSLINRNIAFFARYFSSSSSQVCNDIIHTPPKPYRALASILSQFLQAVRSLIGSQYSSRLFYECLFDAWLAFSLREPVILLASSPVPLSFLVNKRRGGFNIFVPFNEHDASICQIHLSQCARLKITSAVDYCDPVRILLLRRTLASCDNIVAISPRIPFSYISSSLIPYSAFPIFPELALPSDPNVAILSNNGSDRLLSSSDSFQENQGSSSIVFTYIAFSSPLKGLHLLLDAWEAADLSSRASLNIYGPLEYSYDEYVINRLLHYKSNNHPLLRGHLPRYEINKAIDASSWLIIPSLSDFYPFTFVEACYRHVPSIISSSCGLSDYITPFYNGIVYEGLSVDSLTDSIRWAYDNCRQRSCISSNLAKSLCEWQAANPSNIDRFFSYLSSISSD